MNARLWQAASIVFHRVPPAARRPFCETGLHALIGAFDTVGKCRHWCFSYSSSPHPKMFFYIIYKHMSDQFMMDKIYAEGSLFYLV